MESLKKVSRIDYLDYLSYGSGALLQKIEVGASAGRAIYLDFYCVLFRELLPGVIFNMFFISIISIKLLPFILAGYVLVFIITKLLLNILQKIKENALINEEHLNTILTRGIFEMITFRINRKYSKEISKYKHLSDDITSKLTKMTLIHELFFTIFAILVALIQIFLVVMVFTHQLSLTIGGLVALIAYINNIYSPIAIFNVIFVQFRLDQVTYKRLNNFYQSRDDQNLSAPNSLEGTVNKISLKDLQLKIQDTDVLKTLNLEFRSGRIYALLGTSGSGKSTIMKTLLGLMKPTAGEVEINDTNLTKINLDKLYPHYLYISQEVPIFEGTLRENIIFDDSSTSDEKIIEALKKSQLDKFYSQLPDGLDTRLGEKGLNISGGERQRIAFTRLFFSSAEVILLDEATSALDTVTEKKLLSSILPLLKDKLVIMITHHISNIDLADEIIVLRKGRVTEKGSPNELIQQQGELWQLIQAENAETKEII
ncbi:ABC transporter ATP-binding protein [Lactovum odontotermitis]